MSRPTAARAALLALAAGSLTAPAGAQETATPPLAAVVGGSLVARIEGSDARVRLVWRMSPAAAPVGAPIELHALQWPGIVIDGLAVVGAGDMRAGGVAERMTAASDASAPVLRSWLVDPVLGDTLVVSYVVRDALARSNDEARLRVPVVLPTGDPPATRSDVFTARLELPPGLAVRGAFPSVLVTDMDPSGARGTTASVSLPVLPRSVDLDLVDGGLGPLGRTAPLEAAALLLILVAGVWGWGRLRETG